MRALNIIETAYRATLEEQDDPVLWIAHVMNGAGADLGLLLRGNAVNYAVRTQYVACLTFGDRKQRSAPSLAEAVSGLIAKGVPIHVLREDLEDRGVQNEELITGLRMIARAELPGLLDGYDKIWHW
jgi:hypothetical protein